MRASLSSGRDEVIVMENENGSVRSRAYDPRRNRWREIPSLARDLQNIRGTAVGSALGSSMMVLGGTSERDFHVYDPAQDTWSLQPPQLPFRCSFPHSIEVAGRLWCYTSIDHEQETFIYDPETRLWTAGPRLPFEIHDRGGVPWHANAFEVHGKFCIMAYFELTPGTVKYSAFVWDPARETWDEAPFPVPPVVGFWCSQIDGHLIVSGKHPSGWNIDRPSSPLTRLFVLSPGSSEWTEWRLPADVARATRVVAIRLG